MAWAGNYNRNDTPKADLPMWRESFAAIEAVLLRAAPVYWGLQAPTGDGSAVVVIPGFLGTDAYLTEMYAWLHRMNYRPYFSGIGINADCPNLLIRTRLNATIDRARRETGRKIHLIGHSLGGMIAMSAGAQRPGDVASVITLGSPFRGKVAHPNVLRAAELVRKWIKARNGPTVLPDCYTGRCPCDFVNCLMRDMPESVMMSAIYSKTDGIVDWRYCITGDPALDFEAPGTHVGLAFNPSVYSIIARRLAAASSQSSDPVEEEGFDHHPAAYDRALACMDR